MSEQIADGKARFDDWETAKVEIRNKVSGKLKSWMGLASSRLNLLSQIFLPLFSV